MVPAFLFAPHPCRFLEHQRTAGEPSIGRKSGTTVTKLMVAEACTWESGVHPVVPAGGVVAAMHVTDTLTGVRFAASEDLG